MEKQRLRATGLVAAGVVAGGILAGTLGAQAANDANDRTEAAPAHSPMRASASMKRASGAHSRAALSGAALRSDRCMLPP